MTTKYKPVIKSKMKFSLYAQVRKITVIITLNNAKITRKL